MEEALKAGANVMGGIDPCTLDRDPARHLDIVFGLAEKYQVPIDIHLHEPGELGVFSTDLVLERTRALGMQGKVTMSHAYQLGSVNEATTRRLIDAFAELDVSLASVAPAAAGQLPIPLLTGPASGLAWARTASVTTGPPTATPTCWTGRGSSLLPMASARTS